MTTTPDGWEGILAPGETIHWQDRPTGAVMWRDLLQAQSLFGLLFAGLAWAWLQGVRWMSGGVTRSAEGLILFEVVGALFIAVGAYMVIGRLFVEAWQRRRTWYTLTDRAAYLATNTFGKRSLKRIRLDEMNLLQLVDEEPGTIWLRQEVYVDRYRRAGAQGARSTRVRTHRQSFGFLHIHDARAVWQQITDLRAASAPDA